MAVIFDKLAYVRRLEQDGKFDRFQAEALSEALHDAVRESVATKQDMAEFRAEVSADLASLRQEVQQQGKELRAHTDLQVSQLKIWILGSVLTSAIALGGALIAAVFGLLLPALRAKGVAP